MSNRIFHGIRPQSSSLSVLPNANYYLVSSNRFNGLCSDTFTINSRSLDAGQAMNAASIVIDEFHGSSGTGVYGVTNGFSIARASLRNQAALIMEPDTGIYNAPVDVLITYPADTVS